MRRAVLATLVAVLMSVASVAFVVPARTAGAAGSGPALQTPVEQLNAAVRCTADVGTRKAVLLVHGTGFNVDQTWGAGELRALPAVGFSVCTVELPERATVTVYRSVEYVVHAVRVARKLSGRKISVIGHSQGGTLPLWAFTFWPDVRTAVDDYVGLAPAVRGTRLANGACALGRCPDVAWQARMGSAAFTRLLRDGLPSGISSTSVYTDYDEVVFPQPESSTVPVGSNIRVQDLCPGRFVEHGLIVGDNVAWAAAVDALTHSGPAKLSRLDRANCAREFLPGADEPALLANLGAGLVLAAWAAINQPSTTAEPPLPDYAQ